MNILTSLLTAAVRAPSGDNTQPWKFEIDAKEQQIALFVDESRDLSPMNAGQRMARIACGAVLENILVTAQQHGLNADLNFSAAPSVTVHLTRATAVSAHHSPAVLSARVTNRRHYDARALAAETLAALKHATPILEDVSTCWINDRQRIDRLARLIGRADAAMFGERSMRRAFYDNIRFDAARDAEVQEGLPVGSLEISAPERLGMRLILRMPNAVLKACGASCVFRSHAQALVRSSSGVCLIVAPDRSPLSDIHVGRAMQRAWLALTEAGLATQPMMSLPVLANALDHGSPELVAALGRTRITALLDELQRLVPELGNGRPAALLRFGYAPPPSARTGRLPLQAVLREVEVGSVSAPHAALVESVL